SAAPTARAGASHVFMTERGGPMTPKAFHALFGRIGGRAKMPFAVHPHMLRHGCGYALANAGHDTQALQAYLGHKNIQHTVRYTELAPDRSRTSARCSKSSSAAPAAAARLTACRTPMPYRRRPLPRPRPCPPPSSAALWTRVMRRGGYQRVRQLEFGRSTGRE